MELLSHAVSTLSGLLAIGAIIVAAVVLFNVYIGRHWRVFDAVRLSLDRVYYRKAFARTKQLKEIYVHAKAESNLSTRMSTSTWFKNTVNGWPRFRHWQILRKSTPMFSDRQCHRNFEDMRHEVQRTLKELADAIHVSGGKQKVDIEPLQRIAKEFNFHLEFEGVTATDWDAALTDPRARTEEGWYVISLACRAYYGYGDVQSPAGPKRYAGMVFLSSNLKGLTMPVLEKGRRPGLLFNALSTWRNSFSSDVGMKLMHPAEKRFPKRTKLRWVQGPIADSVNEPPMEALHERGAFSSLCYRTVSPLIGLQRFHSIHPKAVNDHKHLNLRILSTRWRNTTHTFGWPGDTFWPLFLTEKDDGKYEAGKISLNVLVDREIKRAANRTKGSIDKLNVSSRGRTLIDKAWFIHCNGNGADQGGAGELGLSDETLQTWLRTHVLKLLKSAKVYEVTKEGAAQGALVEVTDLTLDTWGARTKVIAEVYVNVVKRYVIEFIGE